MLSVSQATERAAALVQAAVKAGADAADVLYAGNGSTGVQVRLGSLEDVERSEGENIGLRVFLGRRSASVSSSDPSMEALEQLVERAVAMAREAPEDPYAGLAPEELLYRGGGPDIGGEDEVDPSPAELKERALAAEDVARSARGITNSEGSGANSGRSVVALATSHGFVGGYATSSYSAWVSVISGEGSGMQRDLASHSVRHFADLDSPQTLGMLAAERALQRLDPGKLPSGELPVLFDPRVGGTLVGHLLGAITGSAITRQASFLVEREGEQIFPRGITIMDDPHRPRGLRSRVFDGEGVATRSRALVEDGQLTTWLLDSASARQLRREPTGHAVRGVGGGPGAGATNTDLLPGGTSREALLRGIKRGLYVTELIGQGVNPVTGDYSRGASGFIVEDGEIAGPVAEITIAGNLIEMFGMLVAADDLELRRQINTPTLLIERMTIAGA